MDSILRKLHGLFLNTVAWEFAYDSLRSESKQETASTHLKYWNIIYDFMGSSVSEPFVANRF